MLDFNDIAVFVQVVRAGSFAGAGRRLGMPPNTVSRRVQLLEESLGVRLLQRSTRQLNTTAAGRDFFERCAAGIEDIQQAGSHLAESSGEPQGPLRVTAPAGFFDSFGVELVTQFMQTYPKVTLEFQLSDDYIDLIANAIDVAFRGGQMPDSSLVARKLGDSYRCLLASPAYLARRGVPESLEQLAQEHDCLTASSGTAQTLWRLEGPYGVESIRVTPRLCVNSTQALLLATRAGLGVSLLPMLVAADDVRRGELVMVLPQYLRDLSGFYAVYPHRRHVSLAVSALIDFVGERLRNNLFVAHQGDHHSLSQE